MFVFKEKQNKIKHSWWWLRVKPYQGFCSRRFVCQIEPPNQKQKGKKTPYFDAVQKPWAASTLFVFLDFFFSPSVYFLLSHHSKTESQLLRIWKQVGFGNNLKSIMINSQNRGSQIVWYYRHLIFPLHLCTICTRENLFVVRKSEMFKIIWVEIFRFFCFFVFFLELWDIILDL